MSIVRSSRLVSCIQIKKVMEELTKKSSTDDVNNYDSLFNVKRLKDGYLSIVDKMGYPKFKPYLQRLFHSIELIVAHEMEEFKKIDVKYQDMVRQCHTYEKMLTLLKESNCYELSLFNESSNTYALDDLTKVTPFLAPDLLQSTLGAAAGGGGSGSTSLQFRLPRQRSSLTNNRQFVSTPLGPLRAAKKGTVAPVAQFDDDDYPSSSSFVLTNSLGFPQTKEEKQFVDASTEPDCCFQQDFSCQMAPLCIDRDCETTRCVVQMQTTQTEAILAHNIACQITPECPTLFDFCIQTDLREQQQDFSCQMVPICVDQASETLVRTNQQPQTTQTETIVMQEFACQMTPMGVDREIETIRIIQHDCASQSSFDTSTIFDNRETQTDVVAGIDTCTQYDPETIINQDVDIPDTTILPIVFSQEWPMPEEDVQEISITKLFQTQDACVQSETIVIERECQTIGIETQPSIVQCDGNTQTVHIFTHDCASQSSMLTFDHRDVQTEPLLHSYSSSLFIVPTSLNDVRCSSTIVLIPSYSPEVSDQGIQCDLMQSQPTTIPIEVQTRSGNKSTDRRSIIQQRMDEKEKQMNRIIEEYAMLYGEYEAERRRNMDLTEARDRLADHIKILSDELGDREITQEKLLIRSGQQNKLINYMLPHIDCSPTPKKKHHSTNSFRRLLPKFK